MPRLVEQARRLREELSKPKEERARSTAGNNVALALGTEISELKTTSGSIVSPSQDVKACAAETERDLKQAQKTTVVLDFHQ